MTIAIINPLCSTGGWRYLRFLAEGISKYNLNYKVTIFIFRKQKNNVSSMLDSSIDIQYIPHVEDIDQYPVDEDAFSNHFLSNVWRIFIRKPRYAVKKMKNKRVYAYLEKVLNKYDMTFYSWPWGIKPVNTGKPIFYIPHDFILSHGFGLDGCNFYSCKHHLQNYKIIKEYVELSAIPIVSSDFIRDEFNRLYPESFNKPNVVYVTQFSDYEFLPQKEIERVKNKYQISYDYILFANNNMPHKNLSQVIRAMYYVKQRYRDVKLLISGYGNDSILGCVNTPYYMDHVISYDDEYDIIGIGLVSEDDFSALLQGARMVINASLCEAGGGSSLDAWRMSVPVVMSDIPAFKNQVEHLGTKAEFFKPGEASDIARAIIKILDNPELSDENAKISRKALEEKTDDFIKAYIAVFEKYTMT